MAWFGNEPRAGERRRKPRGRRCCPRAPKESIWGLAGMTWRKQSAVWITFSLENRKRLVPLRQTKSAPRGIQIMSLISPLVPEWLGFPVQVKFRQTKIGEKGARHATAQSVSHRFGGGFLWHCVHVERTFVHHHRQFVWGLRLCVFPSRTRKLRMARLR